MTGGASRAHDEAEAERIVKRLLDQLGLPSGRVALAGAGPLAAREGVDLHLGQKEDRCQQRLAGVPPVDGTRKQRDEGLAEGPGNKGVAGESQAA